MTDRVHIIGEAGTNHNADYANAERLVDIAIDAGCDSIKFQIIYPEGLYQDKLWVDGALIDNAVFGIREEGMLPDDDYRKVAKYAKDHGTAVSSSIFDEHGIDLLDELDPPYFKFASCDLNNSALLKKAAEKGRTMLMSTGMSTLGEVERAVKDVVSTGNENIVLLHCVSVYPAPMERMNMGFMTTLSKAFGFPVGFSDHTQNSLCAIAAVANGATWIEKHYTFDRTAEGFDHANAMEPEAFTQYVADIRATEAIMSPQVEKVGEVESGVAVNARRGVFYARNVAKGQPITAADLNVVRPASELAPNEAPLVVGRIARRDVKQYEAVSFDQLD
jgi:sialic acid synthase SpsE